MEAKSIKAFSLCNEISLDKVSSHFGINKKYKWEDYLTLKEEHLKGVIPVPEGKSAVIFPFGSIVFIDMEHNEIVDVVNYLKKLEGNLKNADFRFWESYMLKIGTDELSVDFNSMSVKEFKSYQLETLAIVLSKSVALEKVEKDLNSLLDEVEDMVDLLGRGILNISDAKNAKMSARILGFKFDTISYIMLLDKPDITWENQNAETLYIQLSQFYELKERYEKIQAKTETLMDITQVFGALTNQRRGNRLEWMVIILIGIEIILTLVEFKFFL
ncbi:MAG TPA: RMD1 family protein [Clostridia bacterium]|nr:RMD1 family protein [Clostridia bacterium]